jgi:hypothetical protein
MKTFQKFKFIEEDGSHSEIQILRCYTLPLVTPNTHFSGLSVRRASHILAKVSTRSEM